MFNVPDRAWADTFALSIANTMLGFALGKRNTCIESCLVGIGVATAFKVLAVEVPVRVQILDPTGTNALLLPAQGEQRVARRRRGFDEHLLLHLPGPDLLVDLTAAQFNRPDLGIAVSGPLVIDATRQQLEWGFEGKLPSGAVATYQATNNLAYQFEEAWREPSTLTTAYAVDNLRAALGRPPSRHGRGRRLMNR